MPKKYIERNKVIESVKNFAKDAIDKGKKELDAVDDILSLINVIEDIPGDKVFRFDTKQLEIIHNALRYYSAYSKEEEIIEQITDICEIMNVIDEKE